MSVCEVSCEECEKVHSFECSGFHWEHVGTDDRSMGPENHYQAENEYVCSCGQNIEIVFNAWEYPVGVENNTSVEINGAEIIKNECSKSPSFEEEPED